MSLRELRVMAALTQAELADQAGLTRQTVVEIEAGRKAPYPSTVRKLAAALEVPPADVVRAIREQQADYGLKASPHARKPPVEVAGEVDAPSTEPPGVDDLVASTAALARRVAR